MNCGLSVAERDTLYLQLRELPDTSPPRIVWQRIEQQARAEGFFRSQHRAERIKWIAGAAIAATVAMLALDLRIGLDSGNAVPGDVFTATPQNLPDAPLRDLNALKVESQVLERNLRLLPQQPAVMKVSTVSTIRDLEERIAGIDFLISDRKKNLTPEQEEVYWRERVRLMNSLVQLRSAQAQRMSF